MWGEPDLAAGTLKWMFSELVHVATLYSYEVIQRVTKLISA